MSNAETMLTANGVQLCVQTFGDAGDPAILLIHGAAASMLWWEAELCERLAAAGRFVIRFDNRDTGRSVSYPPGQPAYGMGDMADDAVGILEALGVERGHLVGRSMAGAIALLAQQRHPEKVASLTLVSTTPGLPGLPPMSADFMAYTSSGGPSDPMDPKSVQDFIVGLARVYSGPSKYWDEPHFRELVAADLARTEHPESGNNHFMIDTSGGVDFDAISVPTMVVHGSKDPVFPIEHAHAMQKAIPGAILTVLEDAGHEVPEGLWDVFVAALVEHTA